MKIILVIIVSIFFIFFNSIIENFAQPADVQMQQDVQKCISKCNQIDQPFDASLEIKKLQNQMIEINSKSTLAYDTAMKTKETLDDITNKINKSTA